MADGSANLGSFYTGLSRDDVGALRALMATNNANVEPVPANSAMLFTNQLETFVLVTSNLATLVAQSLTNTPAALVALYPGLVISGTSVTTTNLVTTNFTAFFTNSPYAPVDSPATVVFSTVLTTNTIPIYIETFGNVVTNHYFTTTSVTIQSTNVALTASPHSPRSGLSSFSTNVSSVTTLVKNDVNGDYYILPTGFCGFSIAPNPLSTVSKVTNVITIAFAPTGVNNVNGQSFTETEITYYTNYSLVVTPFDCIGGANNPTLRQGIDKITFVRANYDSFLGQTNFAPITNFYTLNAITNSRVVPQTFRRIVTQPDFVFYAYEFGPEPVDPPTDLISAFRTIPQFHHDPQVESGPERGAGNSAAANSDRLPGNMGPLLINGYNNAFLGNGLLEKAEAGGTNVLYASFDATTNLPVIYPNGTSITNLWNQLYLQILNTAGLPEGHLNLAYSATLSAQGNNPPFTWNHDSLPPGLTVVHHQHHECGHLRDADGARHLRL